MRKTFLTLALLGLGVVLPGRAEENISWEFEENGSEVPSLTGTIPWTEIKGDPPTTDGRILTIPEHTYLLLDGTARPELWNGSAAGVTVEFRARIVQQAGMFAAGVFAGGRDGRASVVFSETGVQFRDDGKPAPIDLDTTVFHVYRLVLEDYGRVVDLYIDGVHAASYANTGGSNGLNQLVIGGYSGETIGVMEVDYLRWTMGGAYRPEPPR